jgi:hypothetical protein
MIIEIDLLDFEFPFPEQNHQYDQRGAHSLGGLLNTCHI